MLHKLFDKIFICDRRECQVQMGEKIGNLLLYEPSFMFIEAIAPTSSTLSILKVQGSFYVLFKCNNFSQR